MNQTSGREPGLSSHQREESTARMQFRSPSTAGNAIIPTRHLLPYNNSRAVKSAPFHPRGDDGTACPSVSPVPQDVLLPLSHESLGEKRERERRDSGLHEDRHYLPRPLNRLTVRTVSVKNLFFSSRLSFLVDTETRKGTLVALLSLSQGT